MPKSGESSDSRTGRGRQSTGQMLLPLQPPVAALPEPRDLRLLVKRTLALDIKECRWSRQAIADRISILIGRQISISMLDAMVADSKDHRFPAEWIPAWVIATGSRRLLDILVSEAGLYLADQTEHDLAELGRLRIETKKATDRAEELRRSLWQRI